MTRQSVKIEPTYNSSIDSSEISGKFSQLLLKTKPFLKILFLIIVIIFIIIKLWRNKGIILLNIPISNGDDPNYLKDTNIKVNTVIKPSLEGIPLPLSNSIAKCSWWGYLTSPNRLLNMFNESPKKLSTLSIKLEFSYLMWIKVFNIPGNESWNEDFRLPKILLNRNYAPIILYLPESNKLRVGVQTNNEDQLTFYEIPDFFRLQKWEFLGVCLQERNLDIYLNGELNRSFVLPGVPYLNTSQIYLFPNYGFYARVSLILYFTNCLSPDEMKIYHKMNSNSIIPYNKHFYF